MNSLTDFVISFSLIIVILYIISSLLILFILTSNPILWRRGLSKFPFPIMFKRTPDGKTAYWIHRQNNTKGWVILLHFYVGKSESMIERGILYRNYGYSLLFVDGPSHGLSKFSLRANAVQYSENVLKIIDQEKIRNPILHGVSFGSTACVFLSKMIIYKAMILESGSYSLKQIYWSLFQYIHVPKLLYGWIPYLIFFRYRNFDWEGNDPINTLEWIDAPTLIFHTKLDKIFEYSVHAKYFEEVLKKIRLKKNFFGNFITIEDKPHTKIQESRIWKTAMEDLLHSID